MIRFDCFLSVLKVFEFFGAQIGHWNFSGLIPIFRNGVQVCELGSIFELKEKAEKGLAQLHEGIKRFENPHKYPVGLESGLHQTKTDLILKLRHLDNEDLK